MPSISGMMMSVRMMSKASPAAISFHRLQAVIGGGHLVAAGGQHVHQGIAHQRGVFDDQNAAHNGAFRGGKAFMR
ncbi:MAG: hypothetical protein NVV74_18035 [Magnetospirillum sp.]|nr:hypothetical protein [Magnetospirillum sp.]